jgi:hypothetical protein
MNKQLNNWVLFSCLIMMLGIFACKQSTKESQVEAAEQKIKEETGKDVDIKQEGQNVTLEMDGEKITVNEGGTTWPSEIPASIPKLENLKIKKVMRTNDNEMDAWSIIYEGTSVDRLDQYDAALKAAGFKTMKIKTPKGGQTSGEKGSFMVSCTISEEASMLSVQKRKGE